MPSCYIPGCKSGHGGKYDNNHFFSPPKDRQMLLKWVSAIPRKDVPLSDKSRICDLHFSEDMIIKVDSFIVNGDKVDIPRVKWKLKPDACPNIFSNSQRRKSDRIRNQKLSPKRTPEETGNSTAVEKSEIEDLCEVVITEIDTDQNKVEKLVAVDYEKTINSLKMQVENLIRKLTKTKLNLSSARTKINLLEKQLRSAEAESVASKNLSKKQKMIIETILKKCHVENDDGMKYTNEFILESLLLKLKSPEGYQHCLERDLLPLPSEDLLVKLCRKIKSLKGLEREASFAKYFKNDEDSNTT